MSKFLLEKQPLCIYTHLTDTICELCLFEMLQHNENNLKWMNLNWFEDLHNYHCLFVFTFISHTIKCLLTGSYQPYAKCVKTCIYSNSHSLSSLLKILGVFLFTSYKTEDVPLMSVRKPTAVIKPLPHTHLIPTAGSNRLHVQGQLCTFTTWHQSTKHWPDFWHVTSISGERSRWNDEISYWCWTKLVNKCYGSYYSHVGEA